MHARCESGYILTYLTPAQCFPTGVIHSLAARVPVRLYLSTDGGGEGGGLGPGSSTHAGSAFARAGGHAEQRDRSTDPIATIDRA